MLEPGLEFFTNGFALRRSQLFSLMENAHLLIGMPETEYLAKER